MKITAKTLQSNWYQSLCQISDITAARALVQLIHLFDSPEGYYLTHENCPDDLINHFVQAGLVECHNGVFTSEWLQREYIRHAGKAKARRNTWTTACLLSADELLSLGIIPARETDPNASNNTDDDNEPFGTPLNIPGHPSLVKIRLRSRRHLHIYRIAPAPTSLPPLLPTPPKQRLSQSQKLARNIRKRAQLSHNKKAKKSKR